MKNNKTLAFTLVELIVVITILAVLATVAFISFQGYTSSSRDSVRLADLKNISKSFEINRTKGIDFPLPDKKVDISSSGTIFQYQGELSQNILNSHLNIFDGGVDPLTGDNYGYAVNSARNKFQIIGFLENQESVANISINTTFADNSDKYVKSSGDTLGILLDETTNELITIDDGISEIDLNQNIDAYSAVIFNNQIQKDQAIIKTISSLQNQMIFNSCKEILDADTSSESGYYIIKNSLGTQPVYCDMVTDGGGWTLFGINSNKPAVSPIDFFRGYGEPTAKIETYADKQTWSYNIDTLADESLEMLITIQTESISQPYLAESSAGMDLYNGVMMIPNKKYLSMTDAQLDDMGALGIQHKCDISVDWQRTLDSVEITNNGNMQFTTGAAVEGREFEEDIWHWNQNYLFFYRPQYSYCEQDPEISPGQAIQAIFWVR